MAYKKEDYEAAIKLAQQAAQQKQQQATVPGTAASGNAVATSQPKPTVNQGTNPDTSLKSYEQNRPTYQPNTPVQNILNGTKNYETNKPGAYQGTYADQIQGLLNKILNKEKFEYDMNADPLYQQYKDQYTKNGALAMRDTMGAAAALTGGYGSSYATTAASQTYDQYMDALNARVPELQQLAYGQYRDEVSDQYNQLGALQNQDSIDYGRYRDTVGDWQADRQYYYGKDYDKQQQLNYMSAQEYQQYQDALNAWLNDRQYGYGKDYDAQQQSNWQTQFDYGKEQDALSQQNWLAQFAAEEAYKQQQQSNWDKQFDYNAGQDELGWDFQNKQFDYNAGQDAIANSQWDKEFTWSKAYQEAAQALQREQFEYGKSQDAWERNFKEASLAASKVASQVKDGGITLEERKFFKSDIDQMRNAKNAADAPMYTEENLVDRILGYGLDDPNTGRILADTGLYDKWFEMYGEKELKKKAIGSFGLIGGFGIDPRK